MKYSLSSAEGRYNLPPNLRQPRTMPNTGPLNYCTIRRPTGNLNTNSQKRAVQFADQHSNRSNGQQEMVRNKLRLEKYIALINFTFKHLYILSQPKISKCLRKLFRLQ